MNANRRRIIWHSGAYADMDVMMSIGITPARTLAALYYLAAVETG